MKRQTSIKWLLGITLMAGSAAMQQTVIANEPVPLIPRHVLFGNPDKAAIQISPDGKHISYLAAVDGVLNVFVGPIDKPDEAEPVTKDTYRGIRNYFWAYTGDHILYTQDKGGDENWHVYSVNIDTKKTTDLTPHEGVQARVTEVSHRHPQEILVGLNNRDARWHDIHRINILTGDSELVYENKDEYAGFITEDDMKIHFALKMTKDGGSEIYQNVGDLSWTLLTKIPAEDAMTTNPIGLDESGKNLLLIDSRGRNTAALTALNLETGDKRVLAQDPRADISGAMVQPKTNKIQAVHSTYERRKWQILDESIKDDMAALKKVADGEFNVTDRTLDDRIWAVAYVMDNGPVRYYIYDRENKKANFLFTNRQELEDLKLANMHPITIKSRDGLNLVSYLSLPVWTDPDNDARPAKPLPMVLFVHGGPWARDGWGYNPNHQWLTNRGYAVLSVNYRGSTGFGKEFINASKHEWSGKMHDDLIDAVDWAVKTGIADEDKVGIMGGSYGGYATLVGLTFTPDKFACGVDIVGPSNLETLLNSIPPYWAAAIDMFTRLVGDHRTEEGRELLKKCSPLTHVDKIKKPLLIGQGANDPRVKQAESDQIVQAMQARDIPVTYVLFPDEGHGFRRPENNQAFNAVAEAFLSEHLGGRFEEMSAEMPGTTMLIPAGVDGIPEMPPSLKEKVTKTPEDS